MFALRTITTVCIMLLVVIIHHFSKRFTWKRDKASMVGFGFMELVYVLSLICIWL